LIRPDRINKEEPLEYYDLTGLTWGQLTRLSIMVTHNIGVQDRETYVIKRVDEDFFEEA